MRTSNQGGGAYPTVGARPGRVAFIVLCCLVLLAPRGASARAGIPSTASTPPPFTALLDGHVVRHGRVGYQPDFDPIDRVIISALLRHARAGGVPLPDSMLVLSLYLENFQSTTTPILPDILHPNQTATNLGGFMTGKAVMINAAGQEGYRGLALAEVFLDNSVHILVDLTATGHYAGVSPATVRLLGTLTLRASLGVDGDMHATGPLALQVWRVARGRFPSWQSAVRGLTVHIPPMMGTVSASVPTPAAQPYQDPRIVLPISRSRVSSRNTATTAPATGITVALVGAVGGALVVALLAVVAALFWRRRVASARRI